MTNTNNIVFKCLQIVAWIIFVGLSIEAGALLVNFIISIYNPAFVGNLYEKLDLSRMYLSNKWIFFGVYSFILCIAILKAHLFYVVIVLLTKLDLAKPFNAFVSGQITKISYYTFSIGLISLIGRQNARSMTHYDFDASPLDRFWGDGQAFMIMAAIIYVIATIFKKGVALQEENDLTV
ncbi:MAG: hypothetical protein CFE23_11800 [Flavobacterium sp. BFFFF1]|uniref:DUF2975 domain-containing protein n=1 Tax=Flavobacterium sp. BFFFF1 TaxID=2015557 RepID=UPI000BC3FB7F|nr:DUF2975 domain-containing protein [Flavobacterium sp. BFFFF1]OYU79932.1 MAG: hypothetical protein CFE23_11800 [Flavobacterium sp. BFFFF1]